MCVQFPADHPVLADKISDTHLNILSSSHPSTNSNTFFSKTQFKATTGVTQQKYMVHMSWAGITLIQHRYSIKMHKPHWQGSSPIQVRREELTNRKQLATGPPQNCSSLATSGTLAASRAKGLLPSVYVLSIHIIDILQKVVDRLYSAYAHQLNVFYFPSGLCAGRE